MALLVPQPLIDEFFLGMVVTLILFCVAMSIWMKNRNPLEQLFVVFAFGSMILFYAVGDQLWFNSIAMWEMLVVVAAFPSVLRSSKGLLVFIILIFATVLSNDGSITYMILLFALIGIRSRIQPGNAIWRFLTLGILIQLFYDLIIVFVGPIYYSTYLGAFMNELLAFLSSASSGLQAHAVSLGLPLAQLYVLALANLGLFVVIPLALFVFGGKRFLPYMSPAYLLIIIGDVARLANALTPSVNFVGAFYILVLFGFAPMAILGGLYSTGRPYAPSNLAKSHATRFLAIICVLALISSWFTFLPLMSLGPVHYSSDARIGDVYLFDAQVYGARYSPGVLLGPVGDTNSLLINQSATGPPSYVGYALGGPYWKAFNASSRYDIYFANQFVVITDFPTS
jgi:hypothetical protein